MVSTLMGVTPRRSCRKNKSNKKDKKEEKTKKKKKPWKTRKLCRGAVSGLSLQRLPHPMASSRRRAARRIIMGISGRDTRASSGFKAAIAIGDKVFDDDDEVGTIAVLLHEVSFFPRCSERSTYSFLFRELPSFLQHPQGTAVRRKFENLPAYVSSKNLVTEVSLLFLSRLWSFYPQVISCDVSQ